MQTVHTRDSQDTDSAPVLVIITNDAERALRTPPPPALVRPRVPEPVRERRYVPAEYD